VAAAHFDRWWSDYLAPRMRARSRITLMHGDAYFANMLSPREGVTGETYLIDWQSPEAHLGACDLVNLCDTFWTREQRTEGQREQRILRRYLAQLQAHGIRNYGWDDLVLDYRLEIIEWLLTTVQDARNGSKRNYWLPKLQCVSAAFEDWHCADLLESSQKGV
jgi:thiamine kinase-like enzyme